MADRTPAAVYASTKNKDAAKMAGTPAAKQGAGTGTYTSVRGNVHQPESTDPNEPFVPDAKGPVSPQPVPAVQPTELPTISIEPPSPPTVSEMLRPTEEQTYVEQRRYVSPEFAAAQNAIWTDQNLLKLGGIGTKFQNILNKNMITTLYSGTTGDKVGTGELMEKIDQESLKGAGLSDANATTVMTQLTLLEDLAESTDTGKAKVAEWKAANPTSSMTDEQIQEFLETNAMGAIMDAVTTIGTDGTRSVSWDVLQSIIPSVDEAVAHILTTGLADTITVDEKILTSLGYDKKDPITGIDEQTELLALLGLKAAPTVKELQDAVAHYVETKQRPIDERMAIINDPSRSLSERQGALEWLRDQGYKGTLAQATTLQSLNEQVQAADKVIFNGKEMTLEEVLDDDYIAGIASRVLSGELDENDLPADLVTLIEDNAAAFEDMLSELQTEVAEFNDIQSHQENLINNLSDEELSSLGIKKSDKFFTDKTIIDATKFPVINAKVNGTAQQKIIYNDLTTDLTRVMGDANAATALLNSGVMSAELMDNIENNVEFRGDFINAVELDTKVTGLRQQVKEGKSLTSKEIFETAFGAGTYDSLPDILDNLSVIMQYSDKGSKEYLDAKAAYDTIGELGRWGGTTYAPGEHPEILLTNLERLTDYVTGGIDSPYQLRGSVNALDGIKAAISNASGMKLSEAARAVQAVQQGESVEPGEFRMSFEQLNPGLIKKDPISGQDTIDWNVFAQGIKKLGAGANSDNALNLFNEYVNAYIGQMPSGQITGRHAADSSKGAWQQTINALNSLAAVIDDKDFNETPIEKAIRERTRAVLGQVMTTDGGMDWKDKLKSLDYLSKQYVTSVPKEFEDLFDRLPNGQYKLKISDGKKMGQHYLTANPKLQNFIGFFHNYNIMKGNPSWGNSGIQDFLSTYRLYEMMEAPRSEVKVETPKIKIGKTGIKSVDQLLKL